MRLTENQKITKDKEVKRLLDSKGFVEWIREENIRRLADNKPSEKNEYKGMTEGERIDYLASIYYDSFYGKRKLKEYTGKGCYRKYSMTEAIKQIFLADKQKLRLNIFKDKHHKKYFSITIVSPIVPMYKPYIRVVFYYRISGINMVEDISNELKKLPSVRRVNFSGKNQDTITIKSNGSIGHCKQEVEVFIYSYIDRIISNAL